jgi:hypothetical protein
LQKRPVAVCADKFVPFDPENRHHFTLNLCNPYLVNFYKHSPAQTRALTRRKMRKIGSVLQLNRRSQEPQTLVANESHHIIRMVATFAFLGYECISCTQRSHENPRMQKSAISAPAFTGMEQQQPGHCETKNMKIAKNGMKSARTVGTDPNGNNGTTATRFRPLNVHDVAATTANLRQHSPETNKMIKIIRKQRRPPAGSSKIPSNSNGGPTVGQVYQGVTPAQILNEIHNKPDKPPYDDDGKVGHIFSSLLINATTAVSEAVLTVMPTIS